MMATQEQHKAFFSINQFSAVAPNVLNWILASYLMGKGKSAYVYITTIDSTSGKPVCISYTFPLCAFSFSFLLFIILFPYTNEDYSILEACSGITNTGHK